MEKSMTGLAGEYYVLAQLTQRNLVAALTLANAKKVDILVTNQDLDKLYKVEVKTTTRRPARERLFGDTPFHVWMMNEKHETIVEPDLYYCFVVLTDPATLPAFFVVPSGHVAGYVREQHALWLASRRREVATTTARRFRIPVDDPRGFRDAWSVFTT